MSQSSTHKVAKTRSSYNWPPYPQLWLNFSDHQNVRDGAVVRQDTYPNDQWNKHSYGLILNRFSQLSQALEASMGTGSPRFYLFEVRRVPHLHPPRPYQNPFKQWNIRNLDKMETLQNPCLHPTLYGTTCNDNLVAGYPRVSIQQFRSKSRI